VSKPTKPASKPTSIEDGHVDSHTSVQSGALRQDFYMAVLNMSWQLAIVVLLPIFVGVKLDKTFNTHETLTFIGLGVAVLGAAAVMWRAMKSANRLPVPKLTEAQRRAIKKSYEDDDADQ
jgi:hypothetical protein